MSTVPLPDPRQVILGDADAKRFGFPVGTRLVDPKSDQGHLTGKLPCTCIYATAENTPSVRSGHEMGGYVKVMCKNCKDGLSTKYEVAPDGSALPETPEPAEQADSRSDSVDLTERSVSESTSAQALRAALKEAIDGFEEHVQFVRGSLMHVTVQKWKRIAFAENAADHHGAPEPDEKGEGRCARAPIDDECLLAVWWPANRARFTTARQAARAAWFARAALRGGAEPLRFTRSAGTLNGANWRTFNVWHEHADEAERRLKGTAP